MYQLDLTIFRWFNSWVGVNDFLDWNILFRAEYLLYVMIAVVFLFCAFDKNQMRVKWAIIHAFSAGILARFVFAEVIRFFYDRPRPFDVPAEALAKAGVLVHKLIEQAPGHSLPSGHASFSFALAMAVYYYYPKTSILFFLGALAMGAGRVSAGVHWPSDILAGALVGIFSAWLINFIFKKLK
ncbi:hypothetical protein A2924_03190 [Candidatus Giovannonibacteria bacterium RIFCSPLOWO2_01_FULL_44_16]|uniref:Phosphatidic acid phosphatase type 2/haloperoxidase domain-containing protein n=1 Tax=Candidatus Giovannonibacteria bacterium RIFCSPLOWO2_01_FULL_44_16 TaxID=1798348 RepID=A0A1F5X0H0_9BACT|nr:MAG: hypothetical protein A2924_03190 [Candidatus Giovannonibacteria bacterium RIFCSPLOWO2_01_FULL_44_16]